MLDKVLVSSIIDVVLFECYVMLRKLNYDDY